jgi:hypothetical protein
MLEVGVSWVLPCSTYVCGQLLRQATSLIKRHLEIVMADADRGSEMHSTICICKFYFGGGTTVSAG